MRRVGGRGWSPSFYNTKGESGEIVPGENRSFLRCWAQDPRLGEVNGGTIGGHLFFLGLARISRC